MATDRRILFIGGLHRSGTTPVAGWIAQHPDVSAFRDTGGQMDEGQHLQDVYPPARAHGSPGLFALDESAHLTEASPLVSERNHDRIWSTWSRHWDLDKAVLVEKSPPNLIRMRFLQALFGDRSHFLAVVRHPIAAAYATKRWSRLFGWVPPRVSRNVVAAQAGIHTLLRHWVVAHERFLADAPLVDNVRVVRYEDLIADPDAEMAEIFRFVGLEPVTARWDVRGGLNEAYFRRWHEHEGNPVGRAYTRRIVRELEDRVRPFGYSLAHPSEAIAPAPAVARYVRPARAITE